MWITTVRSITVTSYQAPTWIMKGVLIVFALCISATYGLPKPIIRNHPIQSRVANGKIVKNVPHACMVLVHQPYLQGKGVAVLGGGSIISTQHVLTAAHLVYGAGNTFQVGIIVGNSRRLLNSDFALIHENFDFTNYSNDIALIFLPRATTFPKASLIAISIEENVPVGGVHGTLVGFGFTSATAAAASNEQYAAIQRVANACEFDKSHFCGVDETNNTVVCPGDNGAGLYIADETFGNILVGIASRVSTGCTKPQPTGYTRVSLYSKWITAVTGIDGVSRTTKNN